MSDALYRGTMDHVRMVLGSDLGATEKLIALALVADHPVTGIGLSCKTVTRHAGNAREFIEKLPRVVDAVASGTTAPARPPEGVVGRRARALHAVPGTGPGRLALQVQTRLGTLAASSSPPRPAGPGRPTSSFS
jgi:hypothetical protein